MEDHDKERFLKMLKKAMGAYGKPLPDAGIITSWLEILKPYPLKIISAAFASYCDENGEFAPVPAGISKRCKVMDGRPSVEEAWAIALTSRDEANTVVWTQEMAQAFGICSAVFPDKVGARMAFKEAYERLVSESRSAGRPASWSASLGFDKRLRESALQRAQVAGLLAAPAVAALLPNYSDSAEELTECPAGMRRVKEMMAELGAKRERDYQMSEDEKVAERLALQSKKADITKMVLVYSRDSA